MAYHPIQPGQEPDDPEPEQDASDTILQEFLSALQEEPEEEVIAPPPKLGIGERLYHALKGAREPEYAKRVVQPMVAERRSFPARQRLLKEQQRQARIKELGAAYGAAQLGKLRSAQAAAVPATTAAKTMSAEAARDRAAAAVKRGGKIRVLMEHDANGNPINAPVVEDTDEDGNPILRRINVVAETAEGETVKTLATQRPVAGKVIADETGKQTLISPYTSEPITPPGGAAGPDRFKSPSPGIQQAGARALSTIAGFKDMEKVYQDYQATQLGPSPSMGKRLMTQGRGKLTEKFPATMAVMDPKTINFVRARRAALNRYIKDVTGAQFSIKELERYESQLPGPGEGPETAIPAIQALVNQSLEQLRAFIRQNGGLNAMIANPELRKKLAAETDFSAFVPGPATQKWLDEGVPEAEAGATETLPAGIPPGSHRAGRSRKTGRPVWRDPSGKLWSE
jgi:hypothetical protein